MVLTPKFYLSVIVTVVGASFQFYSYAVLNTTQVTLETWINDAFALRNSGVGLSGADLRLFWSFTVSVLAIGGLCGSLVTGWLAERFGRRGGLLINGVVNVVGGLAEALAKPSGLPELLMLGRLILGFCIGVSCGLAPLYLTEIAPVSVRGAVGTTHQIAAAFGDWFCMALSLPQLLGGPTLWPLALAFPALTAALLVVLLPLCPESPRFLVRNGQRAKALDSARQLVATEPEAQDLIADIESELLSSRKSSSTVTLGDWFRQPQLYRPLLIVLVAMVAQQFTGIAAVLSFSSDVFRQAGLALGSAQAATVGVGFVYFAATLPAPLLIERWGRRTLTLLQLSGCLLSLVLLTGCIAMRSESWASWATIGVVGVYMGLYGLGSPVPWLIASELFAQEHRSTAVAVGTFTSFSLSFVVATAYLPLQAAVGAAWSFAPFVVVLSGCVAFLAARLPETQGRHINDIVNDFAPDPNAYFRLGDSDGTPSAPLLPWASSKRYGSSDSSQSLP